MFQTEPQARKESGRVGHGKVEIQNQDSPLSHRPDSLRQQGGKKLFYGRKPGLSSAAKRGQF
jgi:hypothetical protein